VTRSEIAAEMIGANGTPNRSGNGCAHCFGRDHFRGVFTEPGAGSDLGSLQTRAVAIDGGYSITGNRPGSRTQRAPI